MKFRIIDLLLLASLFLAYSCNEKEEAKPAGIAKISIVDKGEFGAIISDSEGMSLYMFANDVAGESNCIDGCLSSWPVFYMEALAVAEGLEAANFSTITRADGLKQTTYNGWPLYYFAADEIPTDVKGEGVGNVWFAAKVDYSLTVAQQSIDNTRVAYLVDAEGNSLYFFENDLENISNCAGDCITAYPSFQLQDDLVLPSIFKAVQFSTISRADGTTQLTYTGKPLYYFSEDLSRGDISGSLAAKWSLSEVQF